MRFNSQLRRGGAVLGEQAGFAADDFRRDDVLAASGWSGSSYMMSSMTSSTTLRRPRAPVSFFLRLAGDLPERRLGELQLRRSSISKSFWYCLTSAFFGSVRICIELVFVQRRERAEHRQAADELGDHAELDDVVGW